MLLDISLRCYSHVLVVRKLCSKSICSDDDDCLVEFAEICVASHSDLCYSCVYLCYFYSARVGVLWRCDFGYVLSWSNWPWMLYLFLWWLQHLDNMLFHCGVVHVSFISTVGMLSEDLSWIVFYYLLGQIGKFYFEDQYI